MSKSLTNRRGRRAAGELLRTRGNLSRAASAQGQFLALAVGLRVPLLAVAGLAGARF